MPSDGPIVLTSPFALLALTLNYVVRIEPREISAKARRFFMADGI